MTTEDITSELAGILNEIAGVDTSKVVTEASFTEDLEVDSLGMVEVVMAAEDKFGVKIPDEDMKDLRTVGDAVAYIQKSGLAG
jgi:acyl carrier protein